MAIGTGQDQALTMEFTHQADSFARAAVMRSAETLDALVAELPLRPRQRWLDVACGPGILSRALAAHVAEVLGCDLTPAMVDKARAEAGAAGSRNVWFGVGDATALPYGDARFHGAVSRFSLHHIPAPARVVAEMVRVVRPGGWVALADHLTSADPAVAAWHQELERLRDPSHWACLPPEAFFALGQAAPQWARDGTAAAPRLGGTPLARRLVPFSLDFEEWLRRGSCGPANRALIERLLRQAPPGADRVLARSGAHLRLLLGIVVWPRPKSAGRSRAGGRAADARPPRAR